MIRSQLRATPTIPSSSNHGEQTQRSFFVVLSAHSSSFSRFSTRLRRTHVNYLRRERGSISPLIDSTRSRARSYVQAHAPVYCNAFVCVCVCRRPQKTLTKNADDDAACALANQMNHPKEALARARCVRSVFLCGGSGPLKIINILLL